MRAFRSVAALGAAIWLAVSPAHAAERYEFDTAHTRIFYFVNHVGFSNSVGFFRKFDGGFHFDQVHPERSSVDITLYPESVETFHDGLNVKLQEADFFNTKAFPTAHFASREVRVVGKDKAQVIGDFTFRGVTRPLVVNVVFNKADYHPVTKDYIAGFTGKTSLKRSDYGMTYGLPYIGDDVQIHMEVEGINLERKTQPHGKKR